MRRIRANASGPIKAPSRFGTAAGIVEDLQAALEEFAAIAETVHGRPGGSVEEAATPVAD
ncbi:hypothetical protein [Streptomyces viridosporus]|uniref:hypothetical protein n=1 Tax=Streptomyces viridosporus TaxID=67581 RepID=UPI0009BCD71B|nr:hypothetical protein [Streptomyces viridosporus]